MPTHDSNEHCVLIEKNTNTKKQVQPVLASYSYVTGWCSQLILKFIGTVKHWHGLLAMHGILFAWNLLLH